MAPSPSNCTTQQSAHHGDQFWTDCERYLLRSLVWHAVGMRESGNGHLGYICDLLTLPQEELEEEMAASRMIKARNDFMSFMSKGSEDTRNIVMQGLLQRLDLWTEPMTVELTRTTDIDIKLLPEELFTFYIAMPAHKEELQPLATLLFNWIVQIALTAEFKHPITLLLDEFTNFGYVSAMDKKLTTIGHRKIPMVMGIQDSVQLQIVYKEFAAVFKTQPGTQIFFKPRDGELAGRIADDLGKKTVIDWDTRGADVIPRKISKLLHSKQDLRALKGECIVFLPDCKPAKLKYRHWSAYKESTSIPPPERRLLEVPHTSLFVDEADCGSLDYHTSQLLAQVQALAEQLAATHTEALGLLEAGETEEAEKLFARAKIESSLLLEAKALLTKSSLAPRPQKPQKGRWVGNVDGRPAKKNSRRPE